MLDNLGNVGAEDGDAGLRAGTRMGVRTGSWFVPDRTGKRHGEAEHLGSRAGRGKVDGVAGSAVEK